MKVCIIHNYYRTSAPCGENMAVETDVELLRARGHEVVTLRWDNDDLAGAPLAQAALSVKCTWNHSAYRRVLRSLRQLEPDVVHIHNTFPQASPAVLYAARRFGACPVVMTIHNYRMLCANGLLFRNGHTCTECVSAGSSLPAIRHGCYKSRLKTLPVALAIDVHRHLGTYYRIPDAVIVLTAFQRDLLSGVVDPGRLYVKPPHYSNPPARMPWRERRRGLLYVGRVSAEKGVHVLIDALAQMPDGPVCHIIGDGDDRARLEAKVTQLGMAGRVQLHGMLSHERTQHALARSRLLVVPSVCNEGFPLVLREAMALGVPAAASRIGSLQEIVKDRWTGRLFDSGQPEALATCVTEMLDDDASLENMGTRVYDEFVARYSESGVYDSLIDIYGRARARRLESPPAAATLRQLSQ